MPTVVWRRYFTCYFSVALSGTVFRLFTGAEGRPCCFQVSRLVVSEIVGRINVAERVACIEKWAAIGDICRCLQNYNGVLQICAAFVNSSVYRLKKTWEKLSKQVVCHIHRSLLNCEILYENASAGGRSVSSVTTRLTVLLIAVKVVMV